MELERSLAPREIPFIQINGKTNLDSLRPFAGTEVMIEVLPELEPRRAATAIKNAIERAGWRVMSTTLNHELGDGWWDGVVVESYRPSFKHDPQVDPLKEMQDWDRADTIADALVSFLHAQNWQARRVTPPSWDLPSHVMKVKIGYRSLPRVKTKDEEEADRISKQIEEELERQRQKWLQQRKPLLHSE